MKFIELIGLLDIFKKPLSLRVAKQEYSSTNFGIFLSCVIYACLGLFFFQSDFYLRTNPKIISQISPSTTSPAIIYKNRPFSFAVRTMEGNLRNDSKYLNVLVVAREVDHKTNTIKEEIKSFHVCNKSDFPNEADLQIYSNSYCLDNSTFVLQGSPGEPGEKILQIHVYLCQNSTENNNSCKSSEEIQEYLKMTSLFVFYKNTIFQLQSYESPMVESFFSSVHKLDPKLNVLVDVLLQKASLITDETVILRKKNVKDSLTFEKEVMQIGLTTSEQFPILTILFLSSKNILTYSRNYQTLTEVFAVIGGLFSFLSFCGKNLSKIDKSVFLTILLMNFLYSFQQHNIEKEKPMRPTEKEEISPKVGQKLNFSREKSNECSFFHQAMARAKFPFMKEHFKTDDSSSGFIQTFQRKGKLKFLDDSHAKKLVQLIHHNEKRNQISFDLFDFIKLTIKKMLSLAFNFKEKLFLRASEIFEEEIDFVKLLGKVKEIDKLKYLLLNEQQMALFDFLEKPMIFVEENSESLKSVNTLAYSPRKRATTEVKFREALNYYEELEQKELKDHIDQKLFNLIEKKFHIYKKYFKTIK